MNDVSQLCVNGYAQIEADSASVKKPDNMSNKMFSLPQKSNFNQLAYAIKARTAMLNTQLK